MKVLFGTHHLAARAGSELFTSELARSVQAKGHQVAIFTFYKGNFARLIQAQGIQVFDSSELGDLSRFTPDIVQTNHITCAHYLRAVFPLALRVHAMLGVIPTLEAPPLDTAAYSLGLAISEEVVDRISRTAFGSGVEIAVFRNWFDDAAITIAKPSRIIGPIRVVVISNHIAPDLLDAMGSLAANREAKVDYFGTERRSVRIDGSLLTKYDLVISIGRTVLLAAACGVPCIMADIHGSDGLLTVENLDAARTVNFSGRLKRQTITASHLRKEIGRLASFDHEALRKRITGEYSLRTRVHWLLSRFETLLTDRCDGAADIHSRHVALSPPSEGLVYAELIAEIKHLRNQLGKAQYRGGQTWLPAIVRLRSLVATLFGLR